MASRKETVDRPERKADTRVRSRRPLVPGYAARGTTDLITAKKCQSLSARGMFLYQMAWEFGLSPQTFYDLLTRRPDLKEAIQRGRGRAIAHNTGVAFKMAQTNPTMMMFWLKCIAGWQDNPAYATIPHNQVFNDIRGEGDGNDMPMSGVLLLPADASSADEWEQSVHDYKRRATAAKRAEETGVVEAATIAPQNAEGGVAGTGG